MSQVRTSSPDQTSNEGRTVNVDVIAERSPGNGGVTFSLQSHLADDDGRLVFDQDRDEMRKLDYYLIEFDLDDRTGLNLQFAPRKEDAFWVLMGADESDVPPCPEEPSYSDEIHVVDVQQRKLTVRNENNRVAKFAYSLGFVKGDGSHVRFE
jgi:hypothetical protein